MAPAHFARFVGEAADDAAHEPHAPGGPRPSSPASVEEAMRVIDSMLKDNGEEDEGGGLFGGAASNLMLPTFNSAGKFTSYERRQVAPAPPAPSASSAGKSSGSRGARRREGSRGSKDKKASGREQSAVEEFISNPSGMNWEDLVKSLKKQKKKKRSRSSRRKKDLDGLATVEESNNEDYRNSPEVGHTFEEAQPEPTKITVIVEESADGADGACAGEERMDTIDFFPVFTCGNHGNDLEDQVVLPPTSSWDDDVGKTDAGKPKGQAGRRYALACIALLVLVGFISGVAASSRKRKDASEMILSNTVDGQEWEPERLFPFEEEEEDEEEGTERLFPFEEEVEEEGTERLFPFENEGVGSRETTSDAVTEGEAETASGTSKVDGN